MRQGHSRKTRLGYGIEFVKATRCVCQETRNMPDHVFRARRHILGTRCRDALRIFGIRLRKLLGCEGLHARIRLLDTRHNLVEIAVHPGTLVVGHHRGNLGDQALGKALLGNQRGHGLQCRRFQPPILMRQPLFERCNMWRELIGRGIPQGF